MKAAATKRAAEAAEMRKAASNRPKTRADAGKSPGDGRQRGYGRIAEDLRKLSLSSTHAATLRPVSGAATAANRSAKMLPPPPTAGRAHHEDAVILAALAILDARLRTPGCALDSPAAVRQYMRLRLGDRRREAFAVLFLDNQHCALDFEVMFEGTLSQTSVYPREVVRRALELNAAAVVFSHNHPSGSAEPSRADMFLTRSLKSALQLVDVRVLDHIVVGGADTVSFAERDLI